MEEEDTVAPNNMGVMEALGVFMLLVGGLLSAIMVFERHTPGSGWKSVTTFYALVGAALVVVGAAIVFAPSI